VHARPATPEAMQPHEMIGPCAPRPFNVARVRWRDRPRRSREQHARIRRRRR
jgi:hypothetical protein